MSSMHRKRLAIRAGFGFGGCRMKFRCWQDCVQEPIALTVWFERCGT